MKTIHTPVLIIGGGPVGFALALELAYQGCKSMLVERTPATANEILAKAGTLSERTLEFCRRWGINGEVAGWGADGDYPRDTVYCTSLHGYLIGRDLVASANKRKAPESSPEMLRKCPQHIFDPILSRAVDDAAMTDVRYETEFLSLTQEEDIVVVRLKDLVTQTEYSVHANYVVGCDGAGSAVRKALDTPFTGKTLDFSVSAMLRIKDLHKLHPLGKATRYMFIDENGTWANLTSVDYRDLWRFTVLGENEQIVDRACFSKKLHRALDSTDISYELMTISPWRRSQCTAENYVKGRVVLAGDAAHTTSPTGGHGLNTGLGDVVGLGWMLTALVRGWGGEGLLAAYEAERRPVAIRNGQASTLNYEAWTGGRGLDFSKMLADGVEADEARIIAGRKLSNMLKREWHSLGIRMGYRYEGSPIIVPDGTSEPPDDISEYIQVARPGHRAPHGWLSDNQSTLDLFGKGFVLLCFETERHCAGKIASVAQQKGIPFVEYQIRDKRIQKLYDANYVLVRPDGHVAWRSNTVPSDCEDLLDRISGRLIVRDIEDLDSERKVYV